MSDTRFRDQCTEAQRLYFFDLCVALLFKYKQKDDIIAMVSAGVLIRSSAHGADCSVEVGGMGVAVM